MPVEIKIPEVGESVTEALLARWLKAEGEAIRQDEPLVELETDKVNVEVPSPAAGVLTKQTLKEGATARVGTVIGYIEVGATGQAPKPANAPTDVTAATTGGATTGGATASGASPASGVGRAPAPRSAQPSVAPPSSAPPKAPAALQSATPVPKNAPQPSQPASPTSQPAAPLSEPAANPAPSASPETPVRANDEELVPMSPIRRRIAERLVQAQQTAALLTTINEIDMTAVMALRQEHQEAFQQRHGVKLGLISFFVKAAIDALGQFPALNAEIRGQDILYHHYYDIGIAVSTERGLTVPVIRNAGQLSFAAIEKVVADFADRAHQNKLKLEELQGGTFTITNGGVFGSLLSTPIVNPPQSGVLGLHAIQQRPVARDGQVVIRPMMYVALTYDHRIIDGREAVLFLKRMVETVEQPLRLLVDI